MSSLIRKVPLITLFAATALSVFFFLLNFLYMQQYLDGDQIAYLYNMKSAIEGALPVYNPHHLHMEDGGKQFHEMMVALFGASGYTDLVFNNRLRSIITASIGIFFLVLYVKDMTGRLGWAILSGLLVGFAHSYLSYATKIDTPIYPACGMILTLWIVHKIETSKRYTLVFALLGGIILFLSVMFHQYMGISCAAACIAVCIPPFLFPGKRLALSPFSIVKSEPRASLDAKPAIRYAAAAVMGVSAVVLIVAGYFYAGKTVYNLPFDNGERGTTRGIFGKSLFQKWILGYATLGAWGKGFVAFDPAQPLTGYRQSFLANAFKGDNVWNYDPYANYSLRDPANNKSFVYNLLAYFTAIGVFGSVLLFPLLWMRYRRSFFCVLACAVGFSVFTTYWEANYYEFWIVPGLLVSILVVLVCNLLGEKLAPILKRFSHLPLYCAMLVFICFIARHNIQYDSIPFSEKKLLGGYPRFMTRPYVESLFPVAIYKYPDDPHKAIKKNK